MAKDFEGVEDNNRHFKFVVRIQSSRRCKGGWGQKLLYFHNLTFTGEMTLGNDDHDDEDQESLNTTSKHFDDAMIMMKIRSLQTQLNA